MSWTLLVTDTRGTRELLLTDGLAVGRDVLCEISADDPELSRRHAEFRLTGGEVLVVDLESTNGISVNGTPTRRAALRHGDTVQMAGIRIELVERAALDREVAETDGTRLLRIAADTDADATVFDAAPAAAVPPPRRAADTPESPLAVARQARTSWAGRVLIQVVGLGAFAALAMVFVMTFWHGRSIDSVAAARATTLVDWLAAAAADAHDRPALEGVTTMLLHESGVMNAVIVGLDGRVVAPATRAGEMRAELPGAGPVAGVYRLHATVAGGSIEAVRPVVDAAGARRAIAWITFRAPIEDRAAAVLLVGPALLVIFAASLVVASGVRRTTLRGLSVLNEDIDLAIAGQLDEVKDPLGAKPIRELADTVNYLIFRARTSGAGGEAPLPLPMAVARARDDAAGSTPAADGRAGEARLTADSRFRITSASPECADLIGTPARDLLGQHLVDALGSPSLVEAVLTCLGQLSGAGEQQFTYADDVTHAPVHVAISRTEKDGPVAIVIRRGHEANAV